MDYVESPAGLVSVANADYGPLNVRSENVLVAEAFTLLDYLCLFREAKKSPVVEDIVKSKVIAEIIKYQKRIHSDIYDGFVCEAASYCLCAAIDEAVLENSDSLACSWASQTLLCIFHSDTWGGERVFELHSQARKNNLHDLEELIYIIISLGFKGKYFDSNGERESLRKQTPSQTSSEINELDKLIQPVSIVHYNIVHKAFSIKMASLFILLVWGALNFNLWYLFASNTHAIKRNIEQLQRVDTL